MRPESPILIYIVVLNEDINARALPPLRFGIVQQMGLYWGGLQVTQDDLTAMSNEQHT